jgi:hypothetical protein
MKLVHIFKQFSMNILILNQILVFFKCIFILEKYLDTFLKYYF